MTWRLRILGGFILAAFAALSLYYIQYYINPKPHAVVLFIAPGLSPDVLKRAQLQAQEEGKPLKYLLSMQQNSLVDNETDGRNPPDVPALMSELASGEKAMTGALGYSVAGKRLDTLFYKAQRLGRSVGYVTTADPAHPAVAAFYAHVRNMENRGGILEQTLDSARISVMFSGGANDYSLLKISGGRDLVREATLEGAATVHTVREAEETTAWWTSRVLGLFGPHQLPFPAFPSEPDEVGLTFLARRAIQFLQYDFGGYFLIVHDGWIEEALKSGRDDLAVQEVRRLDEAIGLARAYAGRNTVLCVYSPYQVETLIATDGSRKTRALLGFGWFAATPPEKARPLPGFINPTGITKYLLEYL